MLKVIYWTIAFWKQISDIWWNNWNMSILTSSYKIMKTQPRQHISNKYNTCTVVTSPVYTGSKVSVTKISSLMLASVAEQACRKLPKTRFLVTWLKYKQSTSKSYDREQAAHAGPSFPIEAKLSDRQQCAGTLQNKPVDPCTKRRFR